MRVDEEMKCANPTRLWKHGLAILNRSTRRYVEAAVCWRYFMDYAKLLTFLLSFLDTNDRYGPERPQVRVLMRSQHQKIF